MADSPSAPSAPSAPSPPRKGPPKALPLVLAVVVPLVFSLGLSPLLAAVSNPNDNIGRLEIFVADFDGSFLGSGLLLAVNTLKQSGAPLPSLVVKSAADGFHTPDDLRSAVKNSEAWAAVWANSGASIALAAALNSTAYGISVPSYDGRNAYAFVFDEARNNIVSQRIAATARALLAATTARAAQNVVSSSGASPTAAQDLLNRASVAPNLITAPVSYKEENVAPFDVPVIATAQLLGNILMSVFGMALANVILGPLTFFVAKLSPLRRGLARALAAVVYSATVSAAFVTIVVGLANTHATGKEAHYTGNGEQWAQLWALFWLQLLLNVFFFVAIGLKAGVGVLPLFLLLVLLWNVIGGFNTDLADTGFRFFMYAPVFHSATALRYILFGSQGHLTSRSVGIMFLWLFVDIAMFVGASLSVEKKKAAAAGKAVVVSTKQAAEGSKEEREEGVGAGAGGEAVVMVDGPAAAAEKKKKEQPSE
jgi:hypothetical protein